MLQTGHGRKQVKAKVILVLSIYTGIGWRCGTAGDAATCQASMLSQSTCYRASFLLNAPFGKAAGDDPSPWFPAV